MCGRASRSRVWWIRHLPATRGRSRCRTTAGAPQCSNSWPNVRNTCSNDAGSGHDEIRAVIPEFKSGLKPYDTAKRVEALAQVRRAKEFEALAILFKRVKNITKEFRPTRELGFAGLRQALKEPAELALLGELEQRWPKIAAALQHEHFFEAMTQLAPLHAPVDKFFIDVLVMAEDPQLREARLALLATLRDTVIQTSGDISEIAPEER